MRGMNDNSISACEWDAERTGNLTFTGANRRSTIKINVLGLVRLGAVDPNIRTSLYNLLFYKETAAL